MLVDKRKNKKYMPKFIWRKFHFR